MRKPNAPALPKGVKVQQHHKVGNSAADIMRKHLKGPNRLLPPGNPMATAKPRFEEASSLSYHEMLNKVSGVKEKFAGLPASLRQRFKNDPMVMLQFLDDPKNRKEAVRLGLVLMTDAEYMELSSEFEAKRKEEMVSRTAEVLKQALRPDPEAQPNYKKGGAGDQAGKAE